MKIKRGYYVALLLGVAAGLLRVFQYLFTIAADGYTDPGSLPAFLQGALTGLLAVGLVAALLTGFGKKGQLTPAQFTGQWSPLFFLLGLLALVEGVLQCNGEKALLPLLAFISCFAAALGWIFFGIFGTKTPGLLALLPLLHQGLRIAEFFRGTYKYLRVSEYTLTTLGLCALSFFTLLMLKSFAGADCAKPRAVFAACAVLVMVPTAFLAPMVGPFSVNHLLRALEGACYLLLAVSTLQGAARPAVSSSAKAEPTAGPDLNELNEFINNIPELEDENHEDT